MNYRVHQLDVTKDNVQDKLENFLNHLDGQVVSIIPYASPAFQGMGAAAKVNFLLIVEKTQ